MITRYTDSVDTPIGPLVVAVNEAGAVLSVLFRDERRLDEAVRALAAPADGVVWDPERCRAVTSQLAEYFSGTRQAFDLPLAPAGQPFEQRVWATLTTIPYGRTTSYGAIAKGLGDLPLARAVGRANGANPIAVVVPCHRVIGADGSLVGYGGGLHRKEWLLTHEGALLL